MSDSPNPARPTTTKHFSTSILLWFRTDQPRQTGMDHWKGPHSGIISATPGLEEYRQIELADDNPGRWPTVDGVETAIPVERKFDGIAEVTFESALAPLQGRAQTALAYQDEINVFRRTLLYAGLPKSARWYDVNPDADPVGARSIVYLRRRDGVRANELKAFVKNRLVPAVAATGELTELRTQVFLPWTEKTWDTPNVAHDNPDGLHFHASVVLGFPDTVARDAFFTGPALTDVSHELSPLASAAHAYDITATRTYVAAGHILSAYQE
jgi:hypothetical protein